jgi:hypothetical protein
MALSVTNGTLGNRFGGAIVANQRDSAGAAIGYVRVSTEEQATEGVSLEAQRAKLVAYCGLHGIGLAQTYAGRGT